MDRCNHTANTRHEFTPTIYLGRPYLIRVEIAKSDSSAKLYCTAFPRHRNGQNGITYTNESCRIHCESRHVVDIRVPIDPICCRIPLREAADAWFIEPHAEVEEVGE